MGKEMKLSPGTATPPALATTSDHCHLRRTPPDSPWKWAKWPACAHLETLSFRAATEDDANTITPLSVVEMLNDIPILAKSSQRSIVSSSMRSDVSGNNEIESVIHGLRSDRLFFEPGESKTLLVEASKVSDGHTHISSGCRFDLLPYKETVFVSMESRDPFSDFRRSMEEMFVSEGMKDWESLEVLLGWYLKVNVKSNHGYIVGAFIDLLASSSSPIPSVTRSVKSESERTETSAMATATSSASFFSCDCSPSSPMSFPSSSLTTPCLSSSDQVDDEDENGEANAYLPPYCL